MGKRAQSLSGSRRLGRLALLTAVGLLLSWLESWLVPAIAIPGVKPGLANLATVLTLFWFGWRDALAVSLARVLLAGLLFGSLSSLLYALSGALLALAGMALARRSDRLGPVGVSALGGVLHNAAQLSLAAIVAKTPGLLGYFPILFLAGTLTGVLNGVLSLAVLKRVK